MKIYNISFENNGEESILSANVHISRLKSKKLFFSVPSKYKEFVFKDASSFLAGALMRCVKVGENMEVNGSISKKLYENIPTIINKMDELDIVKKKRKISVSANKNISDERIDTERNIGCFFSGGVDSFYTLLKNLAENKEKITHLIFVHGFDIPLWNTLLFDSVYSRMKKVAEHLGVELIPVKTNIREINDPYVEWIMGHGGAVASVALFLRQGFKKIYIASSASWKQLIPNGTHPYLDYLWGTEIFELINDGNEANRTEKVKKYIAISDIALQNIRVCYHNYGNVYNCENVRNVCVP